MYNRQGILNRPVKPIGNPKNQESVDPQFKQERAKLDRKIERLNEINTHRMKVFLGGKSTKTEIVSQAQKDYATQRAAINFRQQKQQEMENKLHSEMINKIKKEEAVERAKLQKKKNWATECYSDNRYLETKKVLLTKKERLENQVKEREELKYGILNYRRTFL